MSLYQSLVCSSNTVLHFYIFIRISDENFHSGIYLNFSKNFLEQPCHPYGRAPPSLSIMTVHTRIAYLLAYFISFRLHVINIIIIIIIIGTTARFEPRPSFEASASCLSLSFAAFLQFLSPDFLASSLTPSSHLNFGLPLCHLPSPFY